jgi:hypothetical protein
MPARTGLKKVFSPQDQATSSSSLSFVNVEEASQALEVDADSAEASLEATLATDVWKSAS